MWEINRVEGQNLVSVKWPDLNPLLRHQLLWWIFWKTRNFIPEGVEENRHFWVFERFLLKNFLNVSHFFLEIWWTSSFTPIYSFVKNSSCNQWILTFSQFWGVECLSWWRQCLNREWTFFPRLFILHFSPWMKRVKRHNLYKILLIAFLSSWMNIK